MSAPDCLATPSPLDPGRRQALQHALKLGALLAAGGVLPAPALAWNKAAFDSRNLGEAIRASGGGVPLASTDVTLTAPEIAENGAVVAVSMATSLPNVRAMLLVVEKNPAPLAARFDVGDAVEPNFGIRLKLGESSNVYAVALMADGKALFARREVKVTLGGCVS
ncbi:MAG TPA: thiosulfate oxidation carrier protein SoxY [Ramlibacter sp.]|nr:thiosulfate oxidation carrier protein SoxY [Ramlibacter sp.]